MNESSKQIYFDNASTSLPSPEVIKKMSYLAANCFGNPASTHCRGMEAAKILEKCRTTVAQCIGASTDEIFFTSGGTESNNWILFSSCNPGSHVITSAIEHPSILEPLLFLQKQRNLTVTYLAVDSQGLINPDELKKAITPQTRLVSVIHGNNEIGTVQDLQAIGQICQEYGVPLHSDLCQSLGRELIDVHRFGLATATLNAHKIHGPKGIGAVYCRQGHSLAPLLYGGGQETAMRSGTVNLPAVGGFAEALRQASISDSRSAEATLRDELWKKIRQEFPTAQLNGSENRLSGNLNFRIPGIDGKKLYNELNRLGIFVSLGSACSSTQKTASHVLTAIGLDEEQAFESLRLSLSRYNLKEEINLFIAQLKELVESSSGN